MYTLTVKVYRMNINIYRLTVNVYRLTVNLYFITAKMSLIDFLEFFPFIKKPRNSFDTVSGLKIFMKN